MSLKNGKFAGFKSSGIMSNYEKMLAGEVYDANAPELVAARDRIADLCWQYNNIRPSDLEERYSKLREILGACGPESIVVQPFHCDYGAQIRLGKNFFSNFGLTVLDEAEVTFGDNCFIGPNVSIYTACHSTDPSERNSGREWARPVHIGNDCWIGGSVTILPGVSIGDGSTIGAGSVVTKDIPPLSVAVGNPARVVKKLG